MRYVSSFLLSSVMLVGCVSSRGFDRGALQDYMKPGEEVQITDAKIAEALARKPQLNAPYRVGVIFQDPESVLMYGKRQSYENKLHFVPWRWTLGDKAEIDNLGEELKRRNIASDVFVISDSTISGNDMKSLRLAGAKHGADAILVVRGVAAEDRYNNPWAASYVLLLPAFVLPGNEKDTLFMMNAVLWDVKNEYLYFTADAEGMSHDKTPGITFGPGTKAADVAKTSALSSLTRECKKRFLNLAGQKEGSS